MTRAAIINADDFGISPGVSRGILQAMREEPLFRDAAISKMRAWTGS